MERLWLETLQDVVGRAAHEVKDALNGVHINLEVIRSRSARPGSTGDQLSGFAGSASDQLESLTALTESLLFLERREKAEKTDVALTLRHLATLLVPAAKSDGITLVVEGYERPALTAASAVATRLGLAAGLLALTKQGGQSRCRLEADGSPGSGRGTVVRFSHESAGTCSIPPAVASAIADDQIRTERSGSDLCIVFPGT